MSVVLTSSGDLFITFNKSLSMFIIDTHATLKRRYVYALP